MVHRTDTYLQQVPLHSGIQLEGEVEWGRDGTGVYIKHSKPVQQVSWHSNGDYFATVAADGKEYSSYAIPHLLFLYSFWKPCFCSSTFYGQLSSNFSSIVFLLILLSFVQKPFRKLKGRVQKVLFHHFKPLFFLAVSFNCPAQLYGDFTLISDRDLHTCVRPGTSGTC